MLTVQLIPARTDNYIFLLIDTAGQVTAVVDPADAEPVEQALTRLGRPLTHILNTHHHGDHVGGNLALKQRYGARIVGPRADADRIPGLDHPVGTGDRVDLGGGEIAQVFDVPGHTRGHIAYHFAESRALFCGDTLFALGCGRLFEGTPDQMWRALCLFRDLPPETLVYCAHEYTEANLRFALTIEADNPALQARAGEIARTRAAGQPTVPSTIGLEAATNPFLRADQASVAAAVGLPAPHSAAEAVAVFAEVRRRKDVF